jgi:peptidoglycan L-alanyl-D-glutamate endopeptidase CwlK
MTPIAPNPHFESRDLALLDPAFAEAVKEVIQKTQARGVTMVPFFTIRGPGVQAKLWCRSRTPQQIAEEKRKMTLAGAAWLATLLREDYGVGHPKRDPNLPTSRITNALPGQSWHQWGDAVDCFVQDNKGQPIWSGTHIGYQVYGDEAKKLGLNAGVFWQSFPDAVHIQRQVAGSPLSAGMNWAQIEEEMKKRYKAA